ICISTRKIIVQRPIYDEFIEKFVARTKTLVSGDPLKPETVVGPLVTADAVRRVDERVKDAVAKGATLRTGGTFVGQVYEPTILTDVPYSALASNDETFGPVVIVEPVESDDDAVAVANRVKYGLTSSVLTGAPYRGFELAQRVQAGIVNVNSSTVNDEIHAPMGGIRDSGWGRTGPDGVKDFTDLIWINVRSDQARYPF
ncbi:MAG TPA: aldehyde dehydrogenase family protein, partial [Candidatus Tumulicola sp.]